MADMSGVCSAFCEYCSHASSITRGVNAWNCIPVYASKPCRHRAVILFEHSFGMHTHDFDYVDIDESS